MTTVLFAVGKKAIQKNPSFRFDVSLIISQCAAILVYIYTIVIHRPMLVVYATFLFHFLPEDSSYMPTCLFQEAFSA